jgi:membrane protein
VGLFNLNGIATKDIVSRTWGEIRADDVFGRAAQLAYYFFLALFPFLICVIATLGVFGTADRGRYLLFALLARFLPMPAFQLISNTFNEIIASSGPLKMSFGIIASLWSASMGMSAVMDTLNAAYKRTETRSLIRQNMIAIGLTFGMALLLIISTIIVIIGQNIARALSLPHAAALAWQITKWPLATALLLLGFAITYHFAPDLKHRKWHWISPGAILGAVVLMLVSLGLRIYLHYSGTFSATYGSLGGVIVLLLCFYLGGVAVLSGGALNGVMTEVNGRRERASMPRQGASLMGESTTE